MCPLYARASKGPPKWRLVERSGKWRMDNRCHPCALWMDGWTPCVHAPCTAAWRGVKPALDLGPLGVEPHPIAGPEYLWRAHLGSQQLSACGDGEGCVSVTTYHTPWPCAPSLSGATPRPPCAVVLGRRRPGLLSCPTTVVAVTAVVDTAPELDPETLHHWAR